MRWPWSKPAPVPTPIENLSSATQVTMIAMLRQQIKSIDQQIEQENKDMQDRSSAIARSQEFIHTSYECLDKHRKEVYYLQTKRSAITTTIADLEGRL